jgi:uncharacterized paraquat-inducible protein A
MTRFEGLLSLLRAVGLAMVFTLAAMICATVVFRPYDSAWFRMFGVVAIGAGLSLVGLPILHKMKGIKSPADVETSPLELPITCPRCLLAQTIAAGDSRCAGCRLRFKLEIEEPRCPECNYLLYRLTSPRCPKCGHALANDDIETAAVTAQSSSASDGR